MTGQHLYTHTHTHTLLSAHKRYTTSLHCIACLPLCVSVHVCLCVCVCVCVCLCVCTHQCVGVAVRRESGVHSAQQLPRRQSAPQSRHEGDQIRMLGLYCRGQQRDAFVYTHTHTHKHTDTHTHTSTWIHCKHTREALVWVCESMAACGYVRVWQHVLEHRSVCVCVCVCVLPPQ